MSEWLAGTKSGQVKVDGITLHFEAMGNPAHPPVILLHGFPEFWYSWRHQMPALADAGFYVIAPDQRGYNQSSKVGPYHAERLAADIVQLQEALGIARSIIVGHDWGAVVAWQVAASYPDRVTRLVTMNGPHPLAYLDACRKNPRQILNSWYFFFFQIPFLPEAALRANGCAALRKLQREMVPEEYMSEQDLERYVSAWSEPGALKACISWYRAMPAQLLRREKFPKHKIAAPTCVIWGLDDHALVPECCDTVDQYVEQVEIHRLPGASHHVHQFDPPKVNQLLLDFLTR